MSILFNVRHEAEDTFPPTVPWTHTFTGVNGDAPDTTYWTRNLGYDWEITTIQDNQCNWDTNDGTAYASQMRSTFLLSGDFDVEVEFQHHVFETGVAGDQYSPIMYAIREFSTNVAYISRARLKPAGGGHNGYVSDGNIVPVSPYTQADDTGKLRITRVGNGFYVYIWSGTQWEWFGNPAGRLVGSLVGENIFINFVWTNTAGNHVESAIDNFKINSGTPVAP